MKEPVTLSSVAERTRTPGPLQIRFTHSDKRLQPGPRLSWGPRHRNSAGTIDLDPGCTVQEILGFGAAPTDAACYVLHQLSSSKRQEFLREVFSPAAMGLNTCRICIGSSDYATAPYSYNEGDPDPEMERFSIDRDRQYILPILQEVQRFCPDLFLLASLWSPPGWMKVGGSMLGGSIQRKHFPAYAKYFQNFVESYAAAGVHTRRHRTERGGYGSGRINAGLLLGASQRNAICCRTHGLMFYRAWDQVEDLDT
jgi:glucosylceramidase